MIETFAPVSSGGLNFRQRWASYLTIALAVVAVGGGLLMRNRVQSSTNIRPRQDDGITARYPANWLLQEGTKGKDDYVFRVQDPAAVPFKTTLQVSLLPVGPNARAFDILSALNISRAAEVPMYQALEITPITLPSGTQGTQMAYAYASREINPFLQSVPIIVRSIDVIEIRANQAIIITYKADAGTFEQNRHYFNSFLRALEY
jgi:hypothetical protein